MFWKSRRAHPSRQTGVRPGCCALGAAAIHVFTAAVALVAGLARPAAPARLPPGPSVPAHHPSHLPAQEVRLRLLAVNDFHGALEARSAGGQQAGGAALLAAYLDALEWGARRADGATSIRVHAGDMIGASQAVSALWHDEPTLQLLDGLRFEYGAVGNHELDLGLAELLRLQHGGCGPDGGCFPGVRTQYLAANLVGTGSRRPVLPAYAVREVRGVRVGFVGAVTAELPRLVPPSALEGAQVLDEARAINGAVAQLKRGGVRAIVVLLHEGGQLQDDRRLEGRVVSILEALDREVDVVVSGHTHRCYATRYAGLLVTQACSHGTAVAAIDLAIDPASGDVTASSARLVRVAEGHGIRPDPAVAAFVQRWAERAAPIVRRRIATLPEGVRRAADAQGRSPLGTLVARALRWKTGACIAFVQPSALQADLEPGELTWGELHDALPMGDRVTSLDLTGNQVKRLLEQQWVGRPAPAVLQVAGLRYPWHPERPPGRRVEMRELHLEDGRPVVPGRRYRVATTRLLAEGGLGFTALREGSARADHGQVVDAVAEFLGAWLENGGTDGIRTRDLRRDRPAC